MSLKKIQIQIAFLERVRKKIPATNSIVEELSDLLSLSQDSVYRRLRGQTLLSLDESFKIAHTYQVSLDDLSLEQIQEFDISNQKIVFSYHSQMYEELDIKLHLQAIFDDFERAQYFSTRKMINSAVDIPIFYYFNYDNLARFKLLYWDSSFLNTSHEQLDPNSIDENLLTLGRQIYRAYTRIPSIEIWTETTINSTLEHIQFCHESEMITDEWAQELYNDVEKLLIDLKENAANCQRGKSSFELYLSDISLGNNVTVVHLDNFKVAYMSVNTFGILKTEQLNFIKRIEDWKEQILQKSTLISGVSERQRMKFFNRLLKQVKKYQQV